MNTLSRTYVAIDLKSFYASVECVERGLDPLTTHLVVADESRTDKTICLAVTPALKAYGIPGRARLFEVKQRVQGIPGLTFIAAPPRMQLYLDYSRRIYNIYLSFVAEEDIHRYSVDEVFIDLTDYITFYKTSAEELTRRMIHAILKQTGITATAGIGTNMYLAKVAMDIVAKHCEPDEHGVRLAVLDEMSYRRQLWDHRPLTSFWRIGQSISERLKRYGIETMGQLARASIDYGEWLYQQFGVNAELLIDHAWGYEPCTMQAIKTYHSDTHSLSNGQVLKEPYECAKARIIITEMSDNIAQELVQKDLVTNQITITLNYDSENLSDPVRRAKYKGEVKTDHYGRQVPKHAHGTAHLNGYTASAREIMQTAQQLYDRIANPALTIRRLTIFCEHIISKHSSAAQTTQLDLFTSTEHTGKDEKQRDEKLQEAIKSIKNRFGKNAILRGVNYSEGATAQERNAQIGGHKA